MSNSLWPHGLQAHQASLSFTVSWNLLKFMSIELVMPSNHLILCHPLLLLPSVSPSIRVFFSESALHIRWPKYWRFGFSISPSNEYSGLISFRMDWLDLLAVHGVTKSWTWLRGWQPPMNKVSSNLISELSTLTNISTSFKTHNNLRGLYPYSYLICEKAREQTADVTFPHGHWK